MIYIDFKNNIRAGINRNIYKNEIFLIQNI